MEKATTIDQLYRENPLLAFSVYTHLQVDITRRLGAEVLATLDTAITPPTVEGGATKADGATINRAYGQFWLWVLAAYEVVRTMSQAAGCFSEPLAARLLEFKRHIAGLRIPFAKQEYARGSDQPIGSEASIAGIKGTPRDMSFEVQGVGYSVRELVSEFDNLIQGVRPDDVLHRHGWRENHEVS